MHHIRPRGWLIWIGYLTPPENVENIPPSFAAHQDNVFVIKINGSKLESVLEFAKTINHDGRYGVQFMVPITRDSSEMLNNYDDTITISVKGLVPGKEIEIMLIATFEIRHGMDKPVITATNTTYQLD